MKKKNVDALNARIDSIDKEIRNELKRSGMLDSSVSNGAALAMTGMRYCVHLIDNDELKSKSDADIAKGILAAVALIDLLDCLTDTLADEAAGNEEDDDA